MAAAVAPIRATIPDDARRGALARGGPAALAWALGNDDGLAPASNAMRTLNDDMLLLGRRVAAALGRPRVRGLQLPRPVADETGDNSASCSSTTAASARSTSAWARSCVTRGDAIRSRARWTPTR